MKSLHHTARSAPTDNTSRCTSQSSRVGSDPKLPVGTNLCRCAGCGEYFGGERAFDLHRTGSHEKRERRCLSQSGMRDAGLSLNAKGYWSRAYGVIDGGRA